MAKPQSLNSDVKFSFDNVAVYADSFEPITKEWLKRGLLDKFPDGQVYLSTTTSNARNVVKQLLIPHYSAIFVIGNDAVFERFINLYRELSPNPAKSVPLGFVPLESSSFAAEFGLSITAERMKSLDEMVFSCADICLPEVNSHLALQIRAGQRRNILRYVPQVISKHFMHTPLTKPLSGTTHTTCVNESTFACAINKMDMLGRALAKDQIVFNKRILTFSVVPTRLEPPASKEPSGRWFVFRVESLGAPHSLIPSLVPYVETYLCQRIQLEFEPQIELETCADAFKSADATITLSNRAVCCLVPR